MTVSNRPTLLDLRNVGEYANQFRWNLIIPTWGAPSGIELFRDAVFAGKLNVMCESTNLPKKTVGKIAANLHGHQFLQPGISYPNSDLTLTFVENVEGLAHKFYQYWQEAIWATNIGKGIPYASLVAPLIQLERLSNSDSTICVYNLVHCFLSNYSNSGELTGDANEFLRVVITLRFDDFYLTDTLANSNAGEATFAGTTIRTTESFVPPAQGSF